MENRWSHIFNEEHEEQEVLEPMNTVELKANERLMRMVLELQDEEGLLDDDLPEGFEGEAFIEQPLVIREREFNVFVKVLHYNNIRYRIEPIPLVYKTVGGDE